MFKKIKKIKKIERIKKIDNNNKFDVCKSQMFVFNFNRNAYQWQNTMMFYVFEKLRFELSIELIKLKSIIKISNLNDLIMKLLFVNCEKLRFEMSIDRWRNVFEFDRFEQS